MAVCVACGRLIDDATSACPACGTAPAKAGPAEAAKATLAFGRPATDAPGPAGAELRSPAGAWSLTVRWIVAATVTALLAYLTYSRNGWIPLLSDADLAVHEFGHMITFWAPALLLQFAGSFLQVALPLGLAGYFLWHRDGFAVILMVAWAAESLNNVSVYVYDATRMVLPLFGDDGSGAAHDWHNMLSETGLLGHTDLIAYTVRGLSAALFAASLGLAVWGFVRTRLKR